MRLNDRQLGLLCAVLTVLIWSSFIVISRAFSHRHLLPLDIVFSRMVGACLVLAPWGWWISLRQSQSTPEKTGSDSSLLGFSPLPWSTTWRLGLWGGLLYAPLAYAGFYFAPATHASVLMPGSLPMWTALVAFWVIGEQLSAFRLLALGLIAAGDALVGGVQVLQTLVSSGQAWVWLGDLFFVGASITWAIYTVRARQFRLDPVRGTIAITVFGATVFIPVYIALVLMGLLPTGLSLDTWEEVLFQMSVQGLGSVVISGITFTQMVRIYGPVRSTMITAIVPGLSAMGAILFLNEPLAWHLVLGLVLVTAGILLGVTPKTQIFRWRSAP